MGANVLGQFLTTMFWLVVSLVGLYLAFVPLMILRELKRQGDARKEEAAQIIFLLVRMSGPSDDSGCKFQGEAAKQQAIADLRSGTDD